MIRTYLIAGLALALAGAVAWGAWQDRRADGAEAEAARLERSLKAVEAARDFNRILADQANTARLEADRREAAARRALEHLLTGDFIDADARLDPRISDLLLCLRARAAGDCVPAPGRAGGAPGDVPGE